MSVYNLPMSPQVQEVFNSYPEPYRDKLIALRALILETAHNLNIHDLKEDLKWNEPSYITKPGTTVRLAWSKKRPDVYSLFVPCTTQLIPTFKIVFRNIFSFEGSRGIQFQLKDKLPITELKQCISCALKYHELKHLPYLGL